MGAAYLVLLTAAFVVPVLGPAWPANLLLVVWSALTAGLIVFVLSRFGLLAQGFGMFSLILLDMLPLTTDLSACIFTQGVAGVLIVVGLAGFGFVTATGGRRLFREGFFGDE